MIRNEGSGWGGVGFYTLGTGSTLHPQLLSLLSASTEGTVSRGSQPAGPALALDLPFLDPGLAAPAFSKQWEWHQSPPRAGKGTEPSQPRPRGAASFEERQKVSFLCQSGN